MEDQPLPPWEALHPALTGDRLLAVASLIVNARKAKIDARDQRDTNWNIGCDCHAWVLAAFRAAANSEYGHWLKIVSKKGDLDLVFCIGDDGAMPIKFFRPNGHDQPERTLRQSNAELHAIQQLLDLDVPIQKDSVLRLAVDTDGDGYATAVALAQISLGGDVLYCWPIWSNDPAVMAIEDAPRPEGVELDEPEVGLLEDERNEESTGEAREEGA